MGGVISTDCSADTRSTATRRDGACANVSVQPEYVPTLIRKARKMDRTKSPTNNNEDDDDDVVTSRQDESN
jgi:hypothetical protein